MTVADSGDSGISSSSISAEGSAVVGGRGGGDTRAKNLTSPWAHVVQGKAADSGNGSTSPPCAAEQSETDGPEGKNGNAGKQKKPAWNKPLVGANGEAVEAISSVMGLPSWPDLSESTKALIVESKSVSDGSTGDSLAHVIPHSSHNQASGDMKSNTNHIDGPPTRQRSFKRDSSRGGGGSNSNFGAWNSQGGRGFAHRSPVQPPSHFPVNPIAPNGYPGMVQPMVGQSPYRVNTWEPRPIGVFIPPPYVMNGHGHSYGRGVSFRPHGDGSHTDNFLDRRDQGRGHYGNGKSHARDFVRPSPVNGGRFIPHHPMATNANPFAYQSPEMVYFPVSFVPYAPAPVTMPQPAPFVPALLVRQIEYYFSDANLITDKFLKSQMDDQGWVPVSVIAGFKRVQGMTTNNQLILDCLRASKFIEIQEDKIRRRNDWGKWVIKQGQPDSGVQMNASGSS